MTDVTTPVPASTPIGDLIGGKLHGRNIITDFAGLDVLGGAGATPAAGTMLGWLKAIRDAITGDVDTLPGGAATAANQASELTALAGILTSVDGLETLIAASNAALGLLAVATQLPPTLGAKAASGSLSVVMSSSSDPTTSAKQDQIKASIDAAAPAGSAAAVTPNDATALATPTRAIYVGGAGDLAVKVGGVNVTFKAVAAGSILPIKATHILATNTTATFIVGLA